MRLLALATTLLCYHAGAAPGLIVEDFSTYFGDSSSTAVWNRITRQIHLPYAADFSAGGVPGQEDVVWSIGTGADGVFDAANLTRLDSSATSALITLDANREWHFTTFHLPASVTLRATGSSPLRIHVQGDLTIEGTIDISGNAGGVSQDPPTTGNAGTPGPGGGAGGNGKTLTIAEADTNGKRPVSGANGGIAGDSWTTAGAYGGAGGGGGNSTSSAGSAGQAGAAPAGTFDTGFGIDQLTTLVGGSGGGGGGGNTDGAIQSRGAGGGGGGGALRLHVGGNFVNNGTITTQGGAGGAAQVGHDAGSGGGGGGGAVLIYAVGTGTNGGLILSTGGAGGVGAGGIPDGGAGGKGIHWFGFVDGGFTGAGSEDPNIVGINPITLHSRGPHTLISRPYDSGSTNPQYSELTAVQSALPSDTVTIEVAASHDGFVDDDSGYLPANRISELSGRRFIRYKVTLQSTNLNHTPSVSQISIMYQAAFQFSLVGCAMVRSGGAGQSIGPWLFIGLLLLLAGVRLQLKDRFPRQS